MKPLVIILIGLAFLAIGSSCIAKGPKGELTPIRLLFSLFCTLAFAVSCSYVDLSGTWAFEKDPENVGLEEHWQNRELAQQIKLPGAIHLEGLGDEVTAETQWYSGRLTRVWYEEPVYSPYRVPGNVRIFDFLQPRTYYVGAAWYSREINIPRRFTGRRLTLSLERVHWKSTLFVNGAEVGSSLCLSTPQEYDVTEYLKPGKNRICLRIDNSKVVNTGRIPHSSSDQTMSAWNGVIGKMRLNSHRGAWVEDLQVYPDIPARTAKVKMVIVNSSDNDVDAHLRAALRCYNTPSPYREKGLSRSVRLSAGRNELDWDMPLSERMQLWDEFHPALYRLTLSVRTGTLCNTRRTRFGMREVSAKDKRICINGEKRFIRGNLYCGESPLTGLPSLDIRWWRRIMQRHKDYGHNMVRFHSWCPPAVAFQAADELGIYLQPEDEEWVTVNTDEQENFLMEEAEQIVRNYANSPSFVFFAMGNEGSAEEQRLKRFVDRQKEDGRFLVGAKMNGSPDIPEADFRVTHNINGMKMRHHVGWAPNPGVNLLSTMPAGSAYDYSEAMATYGRPFISHEIGQYCVYPNYRRELPKYTGAMIPGVLYIVKDQLAQRQMDDQLEAFTTATGKWQMRLYKAEYEAILRTRDIAGFHSLSLQDFTGQGYAPVGVMDAFWDDKIYTNPSQFKQFCDTTVILSRIPRFVLSEGDTLAASVELFHFGSEPIPSGQLEYSVESADGRTIADGAFPFESVDNHSNNHPLGRVSVRLPSSDRAAKYILKTGIAGSGIMNSWEVWSFPKVKDIEAGDVTVTRNLDEKTMTALEEGARVLWIPDYNNLKGHLPACFASIYWTTSRWMNGGETMCNSILADPAHPLFKDFPTEEHSNWQWQDVLMNSHPLILDEYGATTAFPKDYRPLLQAIDSWRINRKLALLAECRCGKGRLMISGIDFLSDMSERPVSEYLYSCLLAYMNSAAFSPGTELGSDVIMSVLDND